MLVAIGAVTVVLCVLGGYAAMGGSLAVLWQPFEVVIILGAALGAFLISNPKTVLRRTWHELSALPKETQHDKDSYLELLSLLYQLFRTARARGLLALEQHVEHPGKSALFAQFPQFAANPAAVVFLCDYLRLVSLGSDDPFEIEVLMEEEIETHLQERVQVANAIQTMADGMPALGIVAAVLGVIKTMGAIAEPPEVLGGLIGGALVGTFLGVWLSYGFVGPVANALRARFEAEARYLQCIKAGLVAHLQGAAPAVSVEHARKALLSDVRPSFIEVETATAAPPPA
jgi:chemotaxis protein MotA